MRCPNVLKKIVHDVGFVLVISKKATPPTEETMQNMMTHCLQLSFVWGSNQPLQISPKTMGKAEPADAIDIGRKAIAPMDMTEPPTRIQIATWCHDKYGTQGRLFGYSTLYLNKTFAREFMLHAVHDIQTPSIKVENGIS